VLFINEATQSTNQRPFCKNKIGKETLCEIEWAIKSYSLYDWVYGEYYFK